MIVLWLLAAHLTGDYLLQTRWQATGKFGWDTDAMWLRLRHAFSYTIPFVPVAFAYGDVSAALSFLCLFPAAHFLTDAQRFTRTPGEWFVWRMFPRGRKIAEQQVWLRTKIPIRDEGGPLLMPPNPWPPIGLAIDQTLHLIQIAVLAQIFLR